VNSKRRRRDMKRLMTILLIPLTFMTALSCSKTPHERMIGKYQFSESKTLQQPEYASLGDTEQLKKDMRLAGDSVLEITQDTISWKVYDEVIMAGKYTVKHEDKEYGNVDLILNTDDGFEQTINIGILDDLHIEFLVKEEDAPPLVFKRGSTSNDSAGRAKREKEYKIDVANQEAKSAINNIKGFARAAAVDFKDTIDLESMKRDGLYIGEDVSIEVLNNRIDSLVVLAKHKSGDTEYILDSSWNITMQKILPNDEIISIVKNGTFQGFPGKPIGEAIGQVMISPSWNVIQANDGRYYVNIEGTSSVDNQPTNAIFQLKVNTTDKTFGFNALAFNGKTQNELMCGKFIDAMFQPATTSRVEESQRSDTIPTSGGQRMSVTDFVLDYDSLIGKKVEVQGYLFFMSDILFLYASEESTTAVSVDFSGLSRDKRRVIMEECDGEYCKATVIGTAGEVDFDKGIIAIDIM
jgi:hypothetical protein